MLEMLSVRLISRVGFRTFSYIRNYSNPGITGQDGPYRIVLNVSKFSLEEISVKTSQVTTVNVEAAQKKTENEGEFSKNYVSMHYVMPITHDGQKLSAKFSAGVLVVSAPPIEGDINSQFTPVTIQT